MQSFPVLPREVIVLMQEADSLWEQKEDVVKVELALESYKRVLDLDENNYDACWKIARAYFSLGDRHPGNKETRETRKKVGTAGMKHAKKALELNPQGLEGHYYYALCLSQYSIGIGSVKTILKGLGSEYENHMYKAFTLNKYYDHAGPLRALGRYWYYLPWPKKDLKKSIRYLIEAVYYAPTNVRGQVYLAEAYLKADKRELARNHLLKAIKILPDSKQEVDAQRWKDRARELLIIIQSNP